MKQPTSERVLSNSRERKVIKLDSEDNDTNTTDAAGACLQFHRLPMKPEPAPTGKYRWYHIRFEGGLGGQSDVDINKGRCSAVIPAWALLAAVYNEYDFHLASIEVGESNASIATTADLIVCVRSGEAAEFVKAQEESINEWLRDEYGANDPHIHCTIEKCDKRETVIPTVTFEALMSCLEQIPQGVVKMSETMKDAVETSNNVGRISTEGDHLLVSTQTRSIIDADMRQLSQDIADTFASFGGQSEIV